MIELTTRNSPCGRQSHSPQRDKRRDDQHAYRARSRTPRREALAGRHSRRSPSPRRTSAPGPGSASRRSSPLPHPSRLKPLHDTRQNEEQASQLVSPARDRDRSQNATSIAPPTGPKNALRLPPSGPSALRNFSGSALVPPAGRAAGPPRPTQAIFNAPSRPRGGYGCARGGHVGTYQRDSTAARRTSEYQIASRPPFASGPPTGPRATGGIPPTGPAAYRSSSGPTQLQSVPGQRPQWFLADLPILNTRGRLRSAKLLQNSDKVKKLDLEADRLRRQIEDSEVEKRARLREWERLQGEAESAKIGTELAAERLRALETQDFK